MTDGRSSFMIKYSGKCTGRERGMEDKAKILYAEKTANYEGV